MFFLIFSPVSSLSFFFFLVFFFYFFFLFLHSGIDARFQSRWNQTIFKQTILRLPFRVGDKMYTHRIWCRVKTRTKRVFLFPFLLFFLFFFLYIYRNCETFEICPLFKHLRADECLNIRGTWIRIRYLWTSVKLYQTYNFISLEDPLLHFIRREGDIHRWIEPLFSLPYIDRIRTGHR